MAPIKGVKRKMGHPAVTASSAAEVALTRDTHNHSMELAPGSTSNMVQAHLTEARKAEIIDVIQSELRDRIGKLRAYYSLLGSTFRLRGQMRLNAIPRSVRMLPLRDYIGVDLETEPKALAEQAAKTIDTGKKENVDPFKASISSSGATKAHVSLQPPSPHMSPPRTHQIPPETSPSKIPRLSPQKHSAPTSNSSTTGPVKKKLATTRAKAAAALSSKRKAAEDDLAENKEEKRSPKKGRRPLRAKKAVSYEE
ncbi:hypothetical protein SAICODRAFT_17215 [Saitoella complicata NRRL Y-17804]|uniref:uncharacterized protein n=1 Tax=Saitoella complicata (strain BCRC 22490 / CBS 7301 / JCM 7358 / NBRC 10748 / NRRL Y-17804) TaxID=698492 RepID=UPI0008670191|nr:uncharacterized protein SAICODRAFT_17215 [Saitoella complicata NRRL Y-17804]ODQ55470.1 hypothetical protein SAICODRAFT_17215 [Saitoella complicata NRRL Y-17804]